MGCGFGGLEAAHRLVKYDVELVLIDRTNHHLFQPLLYQVSTAALSPADIASPIRALLGNYSNVSVILGEVTGVDKDRREVFIRDTGNVSYDYLLLATGSSYAWFGHDEWAKHAAVLKTLPDALQIRRRILESFDWAESRRDPEEVKALTSFVIVGGGPTGVELAGSLGELTRATLRSEYRHIDPSKARIVLIDAAPRILLGFPEELAAYAMRALAGLGVEVRCNASCELIDGGGVTINGERIEAANVFWCAGTRAEPVAQWLGASAARNGGVEVTSECSVPGYPEIFSVGDVASFKGADGIPLPGLAPVAKQQGEYVAKVIASRIGAGKHPGPFVYKNLGTMAVIGRSHAVAVLGKIKLTGSLAWLAWSLVHLFLLIGFRNRIIVFVNWAWAYVTFGRGSRLVEGRVRQELEDDHLAGLEKCRPAAPPESR
ncbi:MAG: NAD(P)/FAD-dependent oxidoreductase [Beijerinckiaceae bacterium]|nr:NAD(P)/FAD-dependent oxidoreductase [Beijerinckiaceae bacterium]